MADVRVNARDIIIEVEDETAGTWLPIERLQSVTFSRGENEETAETSDFESQGAFEQDIMQRGASAELEGLEIRDNTTGATPPGRARIEALGGEDAVGYASHGRVRFRYPFDTEWTIWDVTVTLGETGGGTNDKSSWSATLTKSGRSTREAVTP